MITFYGNKYAVNTKQESKNSYKGFKEQAKKSALLLF